MVHPPPGMTITPTPFPDPGAGAKTLRVGSEMLRRNVVPAARPARTAYSTSSGTPSMTVGGPSGPGHSRMVSEASAGVVTATQCHRSNFDGHVGNGGVGFRLDALTGSDAPRAPDLNETIGAAGGEVRWHRESPLARTSGINRMEVRSGTGTRERAHRTRGQACPPTGMAAPPAPAF